MFDGQSRAGERYLEQAARLRQLARETCHAEVRDRLFLMATSFERLADQVEKWDQAGYVRAAAD
jgi:hypothetical protein